MEIVCSETFKTVDIFVKNKKKTDIVETSAVSCHLYSQGIFFKDTFF